MPAIPALVRLRQGNHKFEGSRGYIVRPCLCMIIAIDGYHFSP
jgi:hypothetical protein